MILNAISHIKSSSIPFRWVMVDDGYLDAKAGQLLSFGVDKQKFPNGWDSITSQKDEKIKWMGIWRNFNGYMNGVSPNHSMDNLKDQLEVRKIDNRMLCMPGILAESANAFYNEMTSATKNSGFDIIKVDFLWKTKNYGYGRLCGFFKAPSEH